MMHEITISCLLVTKNKDKLPFLKKAVQAFRDQTFENRELIIVCGNYEFTQILREEVKDLIAFEKCLLFFVDEEKEGLKLGDVRNISVKNARGKYIVNWDDDDINHPLRLETQFRFMQENNLDASFLADQLHYFYDTKEMYWVNWNDGIPGTLMAKKSCFEKVQHTSKSHHEDGDVKSLLIKNFKVDMLKQKGYLYMYSYNNFCVFEREHHIKEIICRKDLSYMTNLNLKTKALNHMRYYNISDFTFIHPNDPFIV
jgi:glycosyltransferase involved in cell wall biosynthesis